MTHIMYYITNYDHVFSSGQWKVPIITGNRPPPSAGFSIKSLPRNRGVMFGGIGIDETGFRCVNDLFLLSFSQNTIVSCCILILCCLSLLNRLLIST